MVTNRLIINVAFIQVSILFQIATIIQNILFVIGTVTNVINSTTQALGTQVQIYDTDRGIYWQYCHMVYKSPVVSIGQQVSIGDVLGTMGETGHAYGKHLHLEARNTPNFVCSQFQNPAAILGIPNEVGTIINYGGTPPPPPPPPPTITWIYKDGALNQAEMENNATIVIDYYRARGLNDYTIASILGNMQAESTIEPWRHETGRKWLWSSAMDTCFCIAKSCEHFRFR